ncbi:MAG TPA: hypothetical protein VG407_13830 [Caulobacteraceae bacterium]|nr:hypothetical protein [Caulobacteraceae bacterium]
MAALLLIALMAGVVQAQTPPDTSDDDGPPPLQNGLSQPQPAMPPIPDPIPDPIRRPVVRPFEMPLTYQPAAPMAYSIAPQVAPKAAVTVENYHGAYEAPADEQQRYYLSGVMGHFEAEQAMLGALDGEWTVSSKDGGPLFTVILNDAGEASPVEGAWRDVRKDHASSIGVIETIDRGSVSLKLSFHSGAGDRLEPTVLSLTLQPDGRWSGELNEAGTVQSVVMKHAPIVPTQP